MLSQPPWPTQPYRARSPSTATSFPSTTSIFPITLADHSPQRYESLFGTLSMKRSRNQLEAEAFPEEPCHKRRSHGLSCQVQNEVSPVRLNFTPSQTYNLSSTPHYEVSEYFEFHKRRLSTKNDYEAILKPQLEATFAITTQEQLTLDDLHTYGTRWLLGRGVLYVVAQPLCDDVPLFREWLALTKSLLWLRAQSQSILQRANFDAAILAIDTPSSSDITFEALRGANDHLQALWRQSTGFQVHVAKTPYLGARAGVFQQHDEMEISSSAC